MRPREFKQRRNGILRVEANDLGAQFTRLLLGIDQATVGSGTASLTCFLRCWIFTRIADIYV